MIDSSFLKKRAKPLGTHPRMSPSPINNVPCDFIDRFAIAECTGKIQLMASKEAALLEAVFYSRCYPESFLRHDVLSLAFFPRAFFIVLNVDGADTDVVGWLVPPTLLARPGS